MIKISTTLESLYGNDYANHIKVGEEYWAWFSSSFPKDEVFELTGKMWHKIRITYIRSSVVFYIIPEYPHLGERYFDIGSWRARTIEPVTLDITEGKFKYCLPEEFSQKRTKVIKNSPSTSR